MPRDLAHTVDSRRPRRVVTSFRLPPAAFQQLSEALGSAVLVDIKESDGTEEIVLVPSSSRQLIGKLRAAFPVAEVIVVEVEDHQLGVELGGQVMRSLDAGAERYVIARSVDELGSLIDHVAVEAESDIAGVAALESATENPLSVILDGLLQHRRHATRTERPTD